MSDNQIPMSLTTPDAALIVGVSPRTLEGYRVKGGGPRFMKFGNRVRYRLTDLEEWMDENTHASTNEY